MNDSTSVAIIGAGPYGLSLAANLRSMGIPFRIFGSAMHSWRFQMPKGMHLKSDGFASNLDDPDSALTLSKYCSDKDIAYADQGIPVKLDTFVGYGMEFQRRFVADLDSRFVTAVEPIETGFRLRLSDDQTCVAGRVVVAVGISYYEYLPEILSGFPEKFVTHGSKHEDLSHFKGRRVAVVGAGASAIDIALLLDQAGASVKVITRAQKIKFHVARVSTLPKWIQSVRRPKSGLGPGWPSRLCTDAPLLFWFMPSRFRLWIVKRHLGPAPAACIKERDLANVDFILNTHLAGVEVKGEQVCLRVKTASAPESEILVDHVIAATGYRPDLRRLPFLSDSVRGEIRSDNHTPKLSLNFESSLRGLYFIGLTSANAFGPLLRFAFGAKFAARRLSAHLRRIGCANPKKAFASH
jgi:thioredoxin reductase